MPPSTPPGVPTQMSRIPRSSHPAYPSAARFESFVPALGGRRIGFLVSSTPCGSGSVPMIHFVHDPPQSPPSTRQFPPMTVRGELPYSAARPISPCQKSIPAQFYKHIAGISHCGAGILPAHFVPGSADKDFLPRAVNRTPPVFLYNFTCIFNIFLSFSIKFIWIRKLRTC